MTSLPEIVNSDTLKPDPSPFAKKPHGPLGRPTIADDVTRPWIAYADDAYLWKDRIKRIMRGWLKQKNILRYEKQSLIIDMGLKEADADGSIGDVLLTLRCIKHAYRQYKRDIKKPGAPGPIAARLAFDQQSNKGFYETGFQPDITGATAIMEQYEAAQRERDAAKAIEQREDLNDWFPRDTPQGGKTVIITDEMINEHELDPQKALFAIPNHLVKSYGDRAGWHVRQIFGAALDVWLAQHKQDTKQAWRLVLQYELKNPGMASTENDNVQNAPEQPEIDAPAILVATTPPELNGDEISSVKSTPKKEIVDMPESPIVVYPMQNGSINYKGIRFSVTLRIGGTFDMALALMDEFAKHIELIDPTCLVKAQPPTNITPMSQPTATATGTMPAPAQTGSKPVLSEQVVKVVREANATTKVVYTGLYTMFGGQPGKYATYQIKDTDTQRLAKINALTDMDWSQAQLFTERAVDITAHYTESDKMNGAGKPYHNLTDLSAALERAS